MNKLEELEKKYEELGKEIEKLKKKDSFTAGWYAYWDNNNNTSNAIEYYIDFIRTDEHLNEKLSDWDNVVKIDKDAFDKLLKSKTIL